MKVIILAAGYGRRMRPLTYKTHKTLMKIGSRTVIEWIIDALLANFVTDISVVTGYLADELRAFLDKQYPNLPINYVHNEQYAKTNNIFSMALALENIVIDKDILLIECDLIFEPSILEHLLACPHPNVALVDRYKSGMDGTVINIGEDDVITDVFPPHLQNQYFDFRNKYKTLNIYRFSKEFCSGDFKKLLTYYAKIIDANVYYEHILGILIYLKKEVIHAQILEDEKWAEIDDPNDLDVAKYIFEPSSRKQILDHSFGGFWNYEILDFCYLRNMYFPTGAVLSEIKNNLPELIHNYSSAQDIINRKLSFYLLCKEENLTVLNGASQIYPVLQKLFNDRKTLIPAPSFGEYRRMFPYADLYYDEIGFDPEFLMKQSGPYNLVVFVNPNNPTGSVLSTDWLYYFAKSHPDKTILIDESFIDFSDEKTILSRIEDQPLSNVILVKSLSKVLGAPGLRLGYVYSSDTAFKAYMRKNLPIWNINCITEYFLEIILKHREAIHESFQKTIQDREKFVSLLETVHAVKKVYPGGGNFLLVSLHIDGYECQKFVELLLLRYNIYVKDVSDRIRGDDSYLRVAVRLPSENLKFAECLSMVNDS